MTTPPFTLHLGNTLDWLDSLPRNSVHTVCTSPPYWRLRSYLPNDHPSKPEEIGLEPTLEEHLNSIAKVFQAVHRVLHPSGTIWLNYGDAWAQNGQHATEDDYCKNEERAKVREYATGAYSATEFQRAAGTAAGSGLQEKQLLMLPERIALLLQSLGFWIRAKVIWHKPNGKPDSSKDRPARGHEHIFLLTKKPQYFYDIYAVREKTGAQLRDVWTIQNQATSDGHTATFPEEIARRCILLGSSAGGCCPDCLEPLRPVYEEEADPEWQRECGANKGGGYIGKDKKDYKGQRAESPGEVKHRILKSLVRRKLLHFKSGCQCPPAPSIPCRVLDPFAGTATTGVVAIREGREFWGCELSPEYHAIGLNRLQATTLGIKPAEHKAGQLSLLEAV